MSFARVDPHPDCGPDGAADHVGRGREVHENGLAGVDDRIVPNVGLVAIEHPHAIAGDVHAGSCASADSASAR